MRTPKDIVREGYDIISQNYRKESFNFADSGYRTFLAELEPYLRPGDRVLDLGCGCGVPTAQYLSQTYRVTGVDISPVQIERAAALVPQGIFFCGDMTEMNFPEASFEAIVSFYAIIHVPLEEQPAVFAKITRWLAPSGLLLMTTGHSEWTGTEADWLGAEMYWSHTNAATYRDWLTASGFAILSEHFIPEGDGGHAVFLAQKSPSLPPV